MIDIEGDCLDDNNQVRASSIYQCEQLKSNPRLFCPKEYDCSIKTSAVKKPVIIIDTTRPPTAQYTIASSTNLFEYEPLEYIDYNNNSQILEDDISNITNETVTYVITSTASFKNYTNYSTLFLLAVFINKFILDPI